MKSLKSSSRISTTEVSKSSLLISNFKLAAALRNLLPKSLFYSFDIILFNKSKFEKNHL